MKWLNRPCKRTELCLNLTLNCGQSFRWKQLDDGSWIGVLKERLWNVKQDNHSLFYKVLCRKGKLLGHNVTISE